MFLGVFYVFGTKYSIELVYKAILPAYLRHSVYIDGHSGTTYVSFDVYLGSIYSVEQTNFT